jgi:hypothetical protein
MGEETNTGKKVMNVNTRNPDARAVALQREGVSRLTGVEGLQGWPAAGARVACVCSADVRWSRSPAPFAGRPVPGSSSWDLPKFEMAACPVPSTSQPHLPLKS